ncbi:hypothetical protein C7M84_013435 [Penaeus vannamei]|uniref:Uncharacterized protein n=1 Tax=Penaeus vannamei TaxID=6689 RepID=A0A3R7PEJ2_PENVA|nr:hypothetical protein C7M84_013435 [Penaeus vannamei]
MYNKNGELVFPLDAEGSLAIVVTPCATPLVWILSLRSHVPFASASESEIRSASLFADVVSNRTIRPVDDPKPLEEERRSSSPRGLNDPPLDTLMEVPILREERKTEEDRGSYKEVVLKEYEGHEATVFQEATAMIGLYVIQVRAEGGPTYVHVRASTQGLLFPPTSRVRVSSTPAIEGVTLTWANRNPGGGYCLVLSEGRPYPSLCAARDAHLPSRHRMRDHAHAPTLLLAAQTSPGTGFPRGPPAPCTWPCGRGGRAGLPWGAAWRGARRRRGAAPAEGAAADTRAVGGRTGGRQVPRAEGRAAPAHHGGGLRRATAAAGGGGGRAPPDERHERPGGAAPVPHAPGARRPDPGPQDGAPGGVAHPAAGRRALRAPPPLPHLPRNSRARVGGVGCSWASLRWSAARASASYCILMEKAASGKPWRARGAAAVRLGGRPPRPRPLRRLVVRPAHAHAPAGAHHDRPRARHQLHRHGAAPHLRDASAREVVGRAPPSPGGRPSLPCLLGLERA